MKRVLIIVALALFSGSVMAQEGCTDRLASNYDSTAVINDGSCIYPLTTQAFELKVNTPGVSENSGIEWVNGNLFTIADNGNPPIVYRIDTTDGSIAQSIHISNYPNNDWEDITSDSNYLYVGDFGNNDGDRKDLKILKIALNDIFSNSSSILTVAAESIEFSYSDQTDYTSNGSSNFNCEAMISVGDSLYIFTKDEGDNQTRVYALPKTPGTYEVGPAAGFDTKGLVTGADYNAARNEVALIGYVNKHLSTFIWYLYDYEGNKFFSGNKRRVEVGKSTTRWQTEGICSPKAILKPFSFPVKVTVLSERGYIPQTVLI